MDRYSSFCILTDIKKLPYDGVIRCTPVHKEKVVMLEARVCKTPGVIHLLVEADHIGDVVIPEVRDVGFRSVQRIA